MLLCQMCGSVCDTELEEWIMFLAGLHAACVPADKWHCVFDWLVVCTQPAWRGRHVPAAKMRPRCCAVVFAAIVTQSRC